MAGLLALVGGMEWRDGCTFDRELLEASGGDEVLVLPTAAAYEHPQRAVDTATQWFSSMGGKVRGLDVLMRPDAESADNAAIVRDARFIYIGGGSPMHLRSVLKDSAVWQAIIHAWDNGAVLAGSSAGAMVLCDPMVDPRGGAFTVGLGLVNSLAVIPHANTWSQEKALRTYGLAPKGVTIVALDEQTAIVRSPDDGGTWRASGVGAAAAYLDGKEIAITALTA
jgi:cyanophycinase